jgi:uncharacterized protein YeaO (DUF488 family)
LPVKTKSIYEPVAAGDGTRVLITRYYPRGVKRDRFDLWLKPLSPSRETLAGYRHGKKSWDEFKEAFLSELRSSQESRVALKAIRDLARSGDVTLLCYEKEGLPCHRHIVKEVLSREKTLTGRVTSRAPARRTRADGGSSPGRVLSRERFYSRRKVGRKAPT